MTHTTKTHTLKTWTEFYQAVICGNKTFEVRKNDRNFQIGDVLNLIEVLPDEKFITTGNQSKFVITYILAGNQWGLNDDVVVLAIKPI